jgi:hypothetical protein
MAVNIQANFLAYLMLFSWPLFGIVFFLMFPARWACAVTLVGGEMFLPSNFEVHFSGLPPFDKDLSVSLAAILGCLIVKPRAILRGSRTERRYVALLLIIIVGFFFTVLTNADPIPVARTILPGLTLRDFVVMTIRLLLYWWPAFFLGSKLFTRAEHLEVLCTVLTVGGLVYSLFILVELKMSPVFNKWVYGYGMSTSAFLQNIRDGGYRPTVFMQHGLNVALFMLMCLLAATGLASARIRLFGLPTRAVVVYLGLILSVIHSSGALLDAIVLVPSLLWMRTRSQARLATMIASLVLFYPLLRFLDLIPVDSVVGFFNSLLGPARAESLSFRLVNEAELLARAVQRPWFGWGGYARQMTFYQWGGQKTVIDGEWIGIFGYSGIVGFVGHFGLLLLPIFVFARKRLRQMPPGRDTILASTVLFISAAYVFDLLPNAGVAPYLTMTVGALAGVQVNRQPQFELQTGRIVAS